MTTGKIIGRFVVRIGITAGMFILYSIAQVIIMLPGLARKGSESAVLDALVFLIVFGLLIWLAYWLYSRFLKREHNSGYGLQKWDRRSGRFFAWMMLALILIQVAYGVLTSIHVLPPSQNQSELMDLMHQSPLPMVLMSVIGAPPVEELIFRGLLMHAFPHQDTVKWRWISGTVSALVFGFAHTGFSDPLNLILYTAMGATFAAVYAYTKDIRYSIGLHFLNNFVSVFL